MPFYPRKTPRRNKYNYSFSWMYFITISTNDREPYFWFVKNWFMCLSEIWSIWAEEIQRTERIRSNIKIHEFIVMPDHVHILLDVDNPFISNRRDASIMRPHTPIWKLKKDGLLNRPYAGPTLWSIIKLLKWNITKRCNKQNLPFTRQSRYHDRIIRNSSEYNIIKHYIYQNPKKRSG